MSAGVNETEPRAGRLPLIGGVLALDFTNTSSGRGCATHQDHIGSAEHLLLWAVHGGAVSRAEADQLRKALKRDRQLASDLLKRALDLRDVLYRIGEAIARSRPPDDRDLDRLRDDFADVLRPAALRKADDRFDWSFTRKSAVSAVLGPIVLSAVDLLRGGQFERLKQCPGPNGDCGWLFFDRSKNNSRRWCEMSVCGNRVKVRRHRDKPFVAEEVE